MMRNFAHFVTTGVLCLALGASCAYAADSESADAATTTPERLFGVLPNYTTVDNTQTTFTRQSTHDSFKTAALGTFDPVTYAFIGVMTATGSGSSYETRYARTFADNAIGNFMTTAIVPSLTREDSRYYRRGTGRVWSRLGYAASRSVVTRSRAGGATVNVAELAGTAAAASLSNLYYLAPERTTGATMTRWGMQVMWDTVANELKEFWPDVRRKLRK